MWQLSIKTLNMATFSCPECGLEKDNEEKYIFRLHNETKEGAMGRGRKSTTHAEGDHFHCIKCHRMKATMGRCVKSAGLSDEWHKISRMSKQSFMQKNRESGQLKTLLIAFIKEQDKETIKEQTKETHDSQNLKFSLCITFDTLPDAETLTDTMSKMRVLRPQISNRRRSVTHVSA